MYLANDVERELGLTRQDLVALAYLLGSDYAEGVLGVGIVNAMEIVQTFSMRTPALAPAPPAVDVDGTMEDEGDGAFAVLALAAAVRGPVGGLGKFKQWLDGYEFKQTVASKQPKGRRGKGKGVGKKNEAKKSGRQRSRRSRSRGAKEAKSDEDASGAEVELISDDEEEEEEEDAEEGDSDEEKVNRDEEGSDPKLVR